MSNKIVTERLIVTRYVKALFDFAVKENKVHQIQQNFEFFNKVITESKKAKSIVLNPFIAINIQKNLINTIKSHVKIDKISQDFIDLLIKNRRLYLFPNIYKTFVNYVYDYNNELQVFVTSAIKLDQKQEKEITDLLTNKYNKKIIFNNIVDSSIIGGLIIKINHHMIDSSINTELNEFIAGSKQSLLTFN